ncbi:methylmalonyl-CoA mutase family protein [Jeotgalibacillus proteolyticus]|nr:methylmalonyl-CoA mutase family protein [Jeotgalibacillus proteolyticus]
MKEDVKNSFEDYTFEQWQQLLESSLKGKTLEDLHTKTYEGITLQPLYTVRPEGDDLHPSRWWAENNDWLISQQVKAASIDEAIQQVKEELKKGTEVISIKKCGEKNWSQEQINALLSLQEKPHLFFHSKQTVESFLPFLTALRNETVIEGIFGYDLLSDHAASGEAISKETKERWVLTVTELSHCQPSLKSLVISTIPYHNAGANAIQELSAALAQASWIINHFAQEGWKVEDIVEKMHIQFPAGGNFFLEVAKLRAFRALWSHFISCYNVGDLPVSLGSESSAFTKTVQDAHVNILRSGNEAFAAALGGVNYLHVEPFDSPLGAPSALGSRIARNIQLILKEETFLKGIADPGGGSYYIETISKQLAEESWSSFLAIEEKGGIEEVLATGILQEQIQQVWEQRVKDSAVRKVTIVGTNRYASAQKNIMPDRSKLQNKPENNKRLTAHSTGEQWEAIVSVLQHEGELESLPPVEIVALGQLKDYKPRVDFIVGILNTAGLKSSVLSQAGDSPVQIICGTNEAYSQYAGDLVLKKKPYQSIYIAGKVEDSLAEEWRSTGLTDTLFEGKDMIEFLTSIIRQLKEVKSQ